MTSRQSKAFNLLICDACSIIFLAKVDLLSKLPKILTAKIIVLNSVKKEVLSALIAPEEAKNIDHFFKMVTFSNFKESDLPSSILSKTDKAVINFSRQHKHALILTDDNGIRKVAKAENLSVLGTVGVILLLVKKKELVKKQAIQLMNDLIEKHHFRISIKVYKGLLRELNP